MQWQCTVQAGGRVIFHIRTHTALHQGQLASFQYTMLSMFGFKINHLYTSTQPPTLLKLSVFCIPLFKFSFRNGWKCNQLGFQQQEGVTCLTDYYHGEVLLEME